MPPAPEDRRPRGRAPGHGPGEAAEVDARLAVGPANYAGQARQWARAVSEHCGIPAFSFASAPLPWMSQGIGHAVDVVLPAQRLVLPWRRKAAVARALDGVTHLAIDGFLAPREGAGRGSIERELDHWARHGVQVALIAHGSEVRDPDAHMARWDYSFFRETEGPWLTRTRRVSARNRAIAARVDVPLLVSTPDLLLDLPTAHWLPLVVDVASWATPGEPLSAPRPTVLHLPSRRHPPIKGTRVIDPVLRRLDDEGVIRYLAPDRVPHAEVPALVGGVDVMVDQIMTGSYGVAAVEAMAAGRLVVGNVAPEVRALVEDDVPVVDAGPDALEDVIRDIAARPTAYQPVAAAGVHFARRWHDGRASAAVIAERLLGSVEDAEHGGHGPLAH
ncbi:hypothetical protein ACFUC1_09320 [Pedococcus sp. NPDC057267]|uniref:hypothetical protein n=1 Tax=Pedococcus sp. NPDC057267 TaxID=3346077 RepID=UPI0036377AE9